MLYGLSVGLSKRQIAEQLWLSPETVKTHAKALRAKLGATTCAQAVGIAVSRGLLSDHDG